MLDLAWNASCSVSASLTPEIVPVHENDGGDGASDKQPERDEVDLKLPRGADENDLHVKVSSVCVKP